MRWNCSARSSPTRIELTAEKRRNPTDDIWSTLTSAVVTDENGEQLSIPANELEIFFFVIAFAGSDTTKNALASGLQAFVANPEQIERYRDDEAVRSSAVEEVLRWASPVTFWTRSTKVDVEMDGITIPKGERVVAMLRSANRDEEVFDDPFTFDIGRAENPHVTFGGGGPHHCLGAMLARAEIRAVLDELLCRADDISLGPAEGRLPQSHQQHDDLRRDADLAEAALTDAETDIWAKKAQDFAPKCRFRLESGALGPGADDAVGGQPLQVVAGQPTQFRQHLFVVLTQRRRRAKQPPLPHRRDGRTAGTDTGRCLSADARGVRRSRGAPVAGSRSPATARSPQPPESRLPQDFPRRRRRPAWRATPRRRRLDRR